MDANQYVLTLSCSDRPGIVAAISGTLLGIGANILDAHQFNDAQTEMFFARMEFQCDGNWSEKNISVVIAPVAEKFGMHWQLRGKRGKQRVSILVSRFDHCLADLLYRWRIGELSMDIVGVISNYPRETFDHLPLGDIPFHYLPVTQETRKGQEDQIRKIVASLETDLVVLARYMQILSSELADQWAGRCINIHHSFLPGFKGPKPYHQAYQRGVKLIGATAHYVTGELDEGPIIEQDVERVSHSDTPGTLVRKGRDIERRVLARAVAWHLEGRVFVDRQKTVVFRD